MRVLSNQNRGPKADHLPFAQGFGVHHALNPDPYRGAFANDGPAYARDVADLIQSATPGRVAGFISESIQGVGGAVPLAEGYLPAVYQVRGLHDETRTARGVGGCTTSQYGAEHG